MGMAIGLGIFSLVAMAVLLVGIPFQAWTFEFAGRRVRVRNFGLRETIAVDEVTRRDTKIGGNGLTEAIHEVVVEGRTLRVQIVSHNGFTVHCTAWEGDRIVFTTEAAGRLAPPRPVPRIEANPRHAAALTLLDELDRNDSPRVVAASQRIRAALRSALKRLPLGSEEDLEEVEDLIEAARTLHVASTRITADEARDEVDDVLDELDAAKEVADLGRRRRAARKLRS